MPTLEFNSKSNRTAPRPTSTLVRAQVNVTGNRCAATQGQLWAGPACTVTSRQPRLALIACVLWLACAVACQPRGPSYTVVDSDSMDSEDLFRPADTVRFDASVLIGMHAFCRCICPGRIPDNGRRIEGIPCLFVFWQSRPHIHSLASAIRKTEGHLLSARFLTGGRMIATTSSGVYAFNADGSCEKRLLEINCQSSLILRVAGLCLLSGTSIFRPPRYMPILLNRALFGTMISGNPSFQE